MRNLTQNAVTENTIRDMAQEQFFIEDKLERDFALGFISEEEYNEGLQGVFRKFQHIYGFDM